MMNKCIQSNFYGNGITGFCIRRGKKPSFFEWSILESIASPPIPRRHTNVTRSVFKIRFVLLALRSLWLLLRISNVTTFVFQGVGNTITNRKNLFSGCCCSDDHKVSNRRSRFSFYSRNGAFRSLSGSCRLSIGMDSVEYLPLGEVDSAIESTKVETDNSSANRALFWNRELGTSSAIFDSTLPVIRPAKIVCLSDPNDRNNYPIYNEELPTGCEILYVGTKELDIQALKNAGCNCVFVSDGKNARIPLEQLVLGLGSDLLWIHSRSAGIDAFYSDILAQNFLGTMTNSKGQFSSTLAEYTMASCLYFAKDFPRLLSQKSKKMWDA